MWYLMEPLGTIDIIIRGDYNEINRTNNNHSGTLYTTYLEGRIYSEVI